MRSSQLEVCSALQNAAADICECNYKFEYEFGEGGEASSRLLYSLPRLGGSLRNTFEKVHLLKAATLEWDRPSKTTDAVLHSDAIIGLLELKERVMIDTAE